jgi:hypothetical protein
MSRAVARRRSVRATSATHILGDLERISNVLAAAELERRDGHHVVLGVAGEVVADTNKGKRDRLVGHAKDPVITSMAAQTRRA